MKMKIHVSGECECGSYLMTNGEAIWCPNEDCQYFGKRFKRPQIELEEA